MKMFTSIYDDASMLPHFLQHYPGLGVSQFFILIIGGIANRLLPAIQFAINRDVDVKTIVGPEAYTPKADLDARVDLVHKNCRPDEWRMIADLDELVQYGVPIEALIESAILIGADHVESKMVDRITQSGDLAQIDGRSIWSQFPSERDFNNEFIFGCARKIHMFKGDAVLTPGCHHAYTRAPGINIGKSNHFRWTTKLPERLLRRLSENARSAAPDCQVFEILRMFDRMKIQAKMV